MRTAEQGNAGRGTHDAVYELLRERVSSGNVMDIPCGTGQFTARLAADGYAVVAADIACEVDLPGVRFVKADMNAAFSLETGELDAVVCIEGIEHLERPFDFLRESRRVTREGGWILLTTPNTSSLRSRWRFLLTGYHNKCKYMLDETSPNPSHHIRMFGFPELRYALHTSGWRIGAVATNRIKPVNWLYAPLAPVQYLATRLAISRAKEQDINRALSRDVLRQMMSPSVLYGESLIVAAQAVTP